MAISIAGAVDLDRDTLLGMYEKMMQIRTFEDLAGKNFAAGLVPGFVHLYAGEEAVAVGICSQLTDKDFITSTHRGHGHCIAKGVDIPGMVAELMGKSSGVCKGKGGSMHIADVEKGMLGANGIVGGGIPLACGAALTAKTLGDRKSTRLNSSHANISYAVFCLKKKKKPHFMTTLASSNLNSGYPSPCRLA